MSGLEKDSYTMDEISEILQISKSAICNMAKRHKIPHTLERKGRTNVSVFGKADVEKFISLSRPKKQYTVAELVAKAAVAPPTIRNIAHKLKIKPGVIWQIPGGKTAVFCLKDAQAILANIKKPDRKEKGMLKLDPVNHPLVTDPRCFITSWFPDPVPKCFKDMDKEIDLAGD